MNIYTADKVLNDHFQSDKAFNYTTGAWCLARPVGFGGLYGLRQKVKAAFLVITDRADVLVWNINDKGYKNESCKNTN